MNATAPAWPNIFQKPLARSIAAVGLAHLKGLTSLSHLWLNKTQITNAGFKELTQAMPRLNIQR